MWKIEEIKPTKIVQFIRVYKKVFGGKPYNEKWTFKEIMDEIKLIQEKHGRILVFYQNGKLLGFVTYRELIKDEHPSISYPKGEDVGYISDIGVLEEHRNRGIGTLLFEKCLENMIADGFTIALMRTLKNGSMSYNIARRHGFRNLEGKEEVVSQKRNNGRNEKDLRIFLDKRL